MEYSGSVQFQVPVSGPDGNYDRVLSVRYQACKAELCKMPTYYDLDVNINIGAKIGGSSTKKIEGVGDQKQSTSASNDPLTAARSKGAFTLAMMVFLAGIGVSLTPCVLPMVPITIGIIGAQSGGSRIKSISLAATYVAGLALVYTILGVAAGATGMMFGSWMQSPWVVGFIGAFFFIMGLAMFGLFDVGVPSSIQTKLDSINTGSGYVGAFVIGMVGALVAGPCSGPVLLSIITLIGQSGELFLGAMLMMIFSLGMGIIFLVAGAFSSTLIQPGMWMDTVKKSFGLVMWAGAIYFVSAHLSDWVTALISAMLLLTTAMFVWPENDSMEGFWVERTRKVYSVIGGIVGAYLLISVLMTKGFILPPPQFAAAGSGNHQEEGIVWLDDETAALAKAKSANMPIMLDFTADWCAACKELEHFTYTDPTVIAESKKMVPLMIDATKNDDPVVSALLDKYTVKGLPTVHFLRPDGSMIEGNTVTGFLNAEQFLPHMNKALKGE